MVPPASSVPAPETSSMATLPGLREEPRQFNVKPALMVTLKRVEPVALLYNWVLDAWSHFNVTFIPIVSVVTGLVAALFRNLEATNVPFPVIVQEVPSKLNAIPSNEAKPPPISPSQTMFDPQTVTYRFDVGLDANSRAPDCTVRFNTFIGDWVMVTWFPAKIYTLVVEEFGNAAGIVFHPSPSHCRQMLVVDHVPDATAP